MPYLSKHGQFGESWTFKSWDVKTYVFELWTFNSPNLLKYGINLVVSIRLHVLRSVCFRLLFGHMSLLNLLAEQLPLPCLGGSIPCGLCSAVDDLVLLNFNRKFWFRITAALSYYKCAIQGAWINRTMSMTTCLQ
jgi:hypothetical protein